MSKDFEEVANAPSTTYVPPQTEADPISAEDWDRAFREGLHDEDKLDLRVEIMSQIALLKSIRRHLFHPDGQPKMTTEFKDIRAYMTSSSQLLNMLQKFEDALKTDEDFGKVTVAIEMALEDCPCPEFVKALRGYLGGSSDHAQE